MVKTLLGAVLLAGTAAGWAGNNPVLQQEGDYFCRATDAPFKFRGELSEWRERGALPLFLAAEKNRMIPDWEGPQDIDATVYLLHDAQYLYFGALVRDRLPSYQPVPEALYRGDGFQLAFDPLDDTILPGYDANDIELGFGRLRDGSAAAYCWRGGEALPTGPLADVRLKITPAGEHTLLYEAAIPWRCLAPFDPRKLEKFGFDVLYNSARDGKRRGWLHWTPGVGEEKLAFLFRNIRLAGKGEGAAEAAINLDRSQYSSGDPALVSLYLPTEQAGKGQVHFTVRQGEREVWRETVGFDAQPGGTVVRWAYQIGRLRGDGLQVDARAVWPGGETALNAELLNLSPESLKQQAQAVAERAFAFRKRLEAARNAGVAVDYPLTALAVCDVTLKYRRRDLEKPALLKEYALLPKIRRQFRQLDAMLERAEQELAGLESGALKPRPVPAPPMRNLTIRDGAFYSGDEEVLLIGPLGWWEPFDDLKSLSELGFNLFSSTLIAQAVTPAPDKVRLDGARRIDRGLREAAKYNLAFDFLISPHPLPQGWKEKHPEMAQYPSGGWIGSSLYHAATRTMIDAMWKNLLPVVRDNPNLIALDLVNEWSFSDGVREIHPVMLAKFRAAMRERYGSVAAANRNWGTDCRDFDSLDPMKLKRVSTGFRYDFESFRNREGLENLRFLRDTARKYAPGTPLHVKSIAVTDLDPGQYLPVGVQREERGEITDFAGSDCAGIMELDFYRSMVPGKPAADTEFHVSVNTTPHEMAADAWSAMLHGESLREYYAWTGRYSAELMAAGALLHIPESLEALGRTALDLRRLAPEVVAFQRRIPDAEVALLYSPASMYTVPEYPARLRRAHAELSHLDLPVRFLSERQLAAGKTGQVKVLVIPGAQRLERETAEALAGFAARGGTILTAPGTRFTDPYGAALPGFPVRESELTAAAFDREFDRLGLNRPVRGNLPGGALELRSAERNGAMLFYAVNYGAPREFRPLLDGKPIAGAIELISGETVKFPLRLPNRKTMIFEVKP